jgi:hypothetical protein
MMKKEAKKILKYKDRTIEIQCMWNAQGNNSGDRNHFKITQTIPEQHTGKARN